VSSGSQGFQDSRNSSIINQEALALGYRRFEELPVWNDAIDLAVEILRLWEAQDEQEMSGLRDQMERAVVSIASNIAEGFERDTNQELLKFLYIASGSAGEVRSMLELLRRLRQDLEADPRIEDCHARALNVSRQLGRWIESIRNSGFEGARTGTDETRATEQAERRRTEFLEELKRIQNQAHESPNGESSLS
jgi:four helix bundle protein